MRYFFKIIPATLSFCLICLANPVNMLDREEKEARASSSADLLHITLISETEKLELRKENSPSLITRVENLTSGNLKLRHNPVFIFRKVGSNRSDIKLGDSFTGRVMLSGVSGSRGFVLQSHQSMDFTVNIGELELVDEMASIEVWRNIFKELIKGEYYLQAEAVIDCTANGKEDFREYQSNEILLTVY